MNIMSFKSSIEDRKLMGETKNGLQKKVCEAVANLTMISKDCDIDLEAVIFQLEQTQNKLYKNVEKTLQ